MTNENRLILNLDLDLLRTFVAVADLNTFGAAALAVCRTQSAVSQQMQRLELLIGKALFARHGRNKLLTEHGVQLLGYARKILRCNDEACESLRASNPEGTLTLWAASGVTESILPAQLSRIRSVYPGLEIDVRIKSHPFPESGTSQQEPDLIIATAHPAYYDSTLLRVSPTLWYSAADYHFQPSEPVPLIMPERPGQLRQYVTDRLDLAGVPWHMAYEARTQSALYAALKAGLGVTVGPVEILQTREVRVLGQAEGLPVLPDTHYYLCRHPHMQSELAQMVFAQLAEQQKSGQYRVEDKPVPDLSLAR